MDLNRFILELRAEREHIERAILSLERGGQLSNGITTVAAQYATGIRWAKGPEDGSNSLMQTGRGRKRDAGPRRKDTSKVKKPPGVPTGDRAITILSVSPVQDDHDDLERALYLPKWKIHKALKLSSAVGLVHENRIPLVVCERDLRPGTWKEMLDCLTLLPQPPYLIVTAKLADDYLWAEALNLGAYDVLAKPFDGAEVNRILSLAWLHWQDRNDLQWAAAGA
jgi:hypothetical protein